MNLLPKRTISFVIPVYNEANRLYKTFAALQNLNVPQGLLVDEVIFVNDGSTDNSKARIEQFIHHHKTHLNAHNYTLISYHKNRGKGYAIKQGMLHSVADYTLFFDADMSTPLSEISKFVPYMQAGIDVIIGTRKDGKSVTKHQPLHRELLGHGFTSLTQFVLGLEQFSDFTCGFKAFSKQAKDTIFKHAKINRWGYDAEIVFLAKKYGLSWVEKAVVWTNDEATKVKLHRAVPETLWELVQIQWNHAIKPLNF